MEIILKPDHQITFYHGEEPNDYDVQIANIEKDSIIKINFEKMGFSNLYSGNYISNGLIVQIFFTKFEIKKI